MRLKSGAFLSPSQNRFFHATGAWLAAHSGLEFDRDLALAPSESDLLFLCGLPTGQDDRFEPLVAPVLAPERYRRRPVYFSDLVVRTGAFGPPAPGWTIAYNGQDSFSGWFAPRSGLAGLGVDPNTLTWIETGSHMASLEAVLTGAADAAGIDSMVMDLVDAEAAPSGAVNTIDSFGPWPAPPVSTRAGLDESVRDQLAKILASMHEDAAGARVLSRWGVEFFAPVDAGDYRRLAEFARRSGSP